MRHEVVITYRWLVAEDGSHLDVRKCPSRHRWKITRERLACGKHAIIRYFCKRQLE